MSEKAKATHRNGEAKAQVPALPVHSKLGFLTVTEVGAQIDRRRRLAEAELETDLTKWLVTQEEERFFELKVSAHILLLSSDEHKRAKVAEVIERVVTEAKNTRPKLALSVASIYRLTAPLKRWLGAELSIDRPLTAPYLARHQEILLLLTEETLKKLARQYPTKEEFAEEYPAKQKDSNEPDEASSESEGAIQKQITAEGGLEARAQVMLASAKDVAESVRAAHKTNVPVPASVYQSLNGVRAILQSLRKTRKKPGKTQVKPAPSTALIPTAPTTLPILEQQKFSW